MCAMLLLVAVIVIAYEPSGVDRDVETARVDLEYGPTVEGSDVEQVYGRALLHLVTG